MVRRDWDLVAHASRGCHGVSPLRTFRKASRGVDRPCGKVVSARARNQHAGACAPRDEDRRSCHRTERDDRIDRSASRGSRRPDVDDRRSRPTRIVCAIGGETPKGKLRITRRTRRQASAPSIAFPRQKAKTWPITNPRMCADSPEREARRFRAPRSGVARTHTDHAASSKASREDREQEVISAGRPSCRDTSHRLEIKEGWFGSRRSRFTELVFQPLDVARRATWRRAVRRCAWGQEKPASVASP